MGDEIPWSASAPAPDAMAGARAEIDRIDNDMLRLVGERLRQGDILAALKTAEGLPLRPAREARILRRLIAASEDKLDADLVIEMWRVLIAANVRRQKAIEIVVGSSGGQDPARQFDLARRHFGARVRIQRVEDVRAALNRAVDQDGVVAVTPWPSKSGVGMWWHILTESRYQKVRIIAALPMRASGDEPEAAVAAVGVPLEEAGGDQTLLIAYDRHYKAARALSEAGIGGVEIGRADTRVLIRLDGFLGAEDSRLAALAHAGLDQVRIVGSYARVP